MTLLPAVGVVSYGSFTFPAALHSSIEYSPIWTSDGRTIKFARLILTVEGILTDTTELDLNDIRTILVTSKLTLIFQDQGFTDLNITIGTDLNYGPKPQMVSWKPIGSNKAAQIVWKVECVVKPDECVANYGVFSDFSYGIEFAIQPNGRTTRLINGYAEIAVRTTGNRQFQTIDDVWHKIVPPYIPGFRREINRNISPDKRSVQFQIIDRQVDSDQPYFPGVMQCQVKHRIASSSAILSTVQIWNISIQGSFTLAPGTPKATAYNHFLAIVRAKINDANLASGGQTGEKLSTGFYLLTKLEIEDDIFSTSVSFNVGYMLVCDLASLVAASGIWKPLPSVSWTDWANSMDILVGKFGSAGLRHQAQDDFIINICNNTLSPSERLLPILKEGKRLAPNFTAQLPPKDKSYIDWRCWVTVIRKPYVINHTPTGTGDAGDDSVTNDAIGLVGGAARKTYPIIIREGIGEQARRLQKQQSSASSEIEVILSGYALRAGYPIDTLPNLESVGNRTVTHTHDNITPNEVVGNAIGVPIYRRTWKRYYLVPDFRSAEAKYTGVPPGKTIPVQ